MPAEMGHVSLVSHEPLGTVRAAEWEVSSVASLVTNQLIAVSELFLTILASVPEKIINSKYVIMFLLY